MSRFTFARTFVRRMAELDRPARAKLRRGLAFRPGEHIESISVVEPWIHPDAYQSERAAFYIVAGLMARDNDIILPKVEADDDGETDRDMGFSVRLLFKLSDESPSIERRFLAVLDSDLEQLPSRLGTLVSYVRSKGVAINYAVLLKDLQHWTDPLRRTQLRWAKSFYAAHEPNDDARNQPSQPSEGEQS